MRRIVVSQTAYPGGFPLVSVVEAGEAAFWPSFLSSLNTPKTLPMKPFFFFVASVLATVTFDGDPCGSVSGDLVAAVFCSITVPLAGLDTAEIFSAFISTGNCLTGCGATTVVLVPS